MAIKIVKERWITFSLTLQLPLNEDLWISIEFSFASFFWPPQCEKSQISHQCFLWSAKVFLANGNVIFKAGTMPWRLEIMEL